MLKRLLAQWGLIGTLAAACWCSSAAPAMAQASAVTYIYDDLGRIAKVLNTATSECAIYEYDAVGNILSVSRRTNCLAAPTITSFVPSGPPGCFLATGQNLQGASVSVDIPGVTVTDLKAADTSVSFCLSTQAAVCSLSGTVTVTTPGGSSAALPVTLTGATSLTAGTETTGSIAALFESDRFCFEVPAQEHVILQATSTAVDPCLRLTTGAQGAQVPGGAACGFPAARLDLDLPAGTYVVDVSDNNGNQTGSYTLAYEPVIAATAAALTADVPAADSVSPLGDLDLFFFSLSASTRVVLQATSNAVDPCLRILRASGDPAVTGGSICGFPAARLDLVLPAGSYFVEVSDNNSNQTGGYTLLYEPVVTPSAVALTADVPANDSVTPLGDLDLYTFTLTATTRVVLQGTSSAIDPCLRVLSAAGAPPVTGGTVCGFPAARLDLVLAAGTYFVEVSDNNNNQTGTYTLLYQPIVAATAVPLTADVPASDSVTPLGDLDLYAFTLTATTRVVLQAASTAIDSCVRVLTAADAPPVTGGTICGFPAARLDVVLAAGTYFVEVSDNNNNQTGAYTLIYEPLAVATAAALTPNVTVSDAITPFGDLDLYTFDLAATTHVVVQADSAAVDPCVRLLTGVGGPAVTVAPVCGFPTARLDRILQPGRYFVELSDNNTNQTGAYTLLFQADTASVPIVTVVATDPDASEVGPDPGSFTFTRTGSVTASLTVAYTVAGTATSGSDYQAIGTSIVIPAGQASATRVVTPFLDTLLEGQETVAVALDLGEYAIGAANAATVTIADSGTVVTIEATDPDAAEDGPNPGTFRVTRTGPTTLNQTVNVAVSGTATNFIDYQGIGTAITIPTGQASATVTVTPILDGLLEGDETVTLTLAAGGYTIGSPGVATVTIADNAPTVSVVATDPSASEVGPDPGTFTFTRTGSTGLGLSLNFNIGGTASNGTDYVFLTTTFIPAGQASVTLTVTPILDALLEGDETVVVTLASGQYTIGAANTATVTIADNAPTVTVVATDASASEIGPDPGTVTFARTGATGVILRVFFTLGGTATLASGDFTTDRPGGFVDIPAGQTTATMTIMPTLDALLEGNETVVVSVAAGQYNIGAAGSATITIADNVPTVTLTATDATASESGSDTGTFTVTRTGPTGVTLPINFAVTGTATAGSDYQSVGTSVLIPAGQASTTVVINPILDAILEGNETVTLTLTTGGYAIGGSSSGTVTIADNVPTVTVVATDAAASEAGSDTGTFTFTRTGPTGVALRVDLTRTGTATAGTDYSGLNAFVIIPAGQASFAAVVTPILDAQIEGNETAIVTLVPGEYVIGAANTATITIADSVPTVTVQATDPTASESGDPGTFTITRTGPTGVSLPVNFTVSGTASAADYFSIGTNVTIPFGLTSTTITVFAVLDQQTEPDETVVLTLAPGGYAIGAPSAATITILNFTPLSTVSVQVSDASAYEVGPDLGGITINRSGGAVDTDLTVNFTLTGTATKDTDYLILPVGSVVQTGQSFTTVIPAGQSFTSLTIRPIADNVAEGQETVTLTLAAGGYTISPPAASGTVTIFDGAPPSTVFVVVDDATAFEVGPDPGSFLIERTSGPIDTSLTVNLSVTGTATSGIDYESIGTSVVIPAGQSFARVTVTPIADAIAEGSETVVLRVTPGPYAILAGSDTGTVTISDGPPPTTVFVFALDPTAYEVGPDLGAFFVTRSGSTAGDLTVNFALTGTATNGVDYENVATSVVIPDTQASADVVIVPIQDTQSEGQETVVMTLTAGAYSTIAGFSSATVTIADGPSPTVLTMFASEPNAYEVGPHAGVFTVFRQGPTDTSVTVNFTLSGTATNADYQDVGTSVVIPAGRSQAQIPIVPIADGVAEAPETVVLTLAPGSYTVSGSGTATVTIADGAEPTAVSIVATDATAFETGADPAVFTVSRTGSTATSLTVNYALTGTATNGVDYQTLATSATIPAGDVSVPVVVVPIADGVTETLETVIATLTTGDYGIVANQNTTRVTIADGAAIPQVLVSAFDSIAFEDGPDAGAFFVQRFGPTTADLTVNLTVTGTATNGTDYQTIGSSVVIPAGLSLVVVPVIPIADSLAEGHETVNMRIAPGQYSTLSDTTLATVTIADGASDVPNFVYILAADPSASETGPDPGAFLVVRTGRIDTSLTVNFTRAGSATNGVDYNDIGSSVVIPAGQASATITVTPIHDASPEGPESVRLTIAAGDYTIDPVANTATVTIADSGPQ